MNETILGKIARVEFGKRESSIGIWFELSGAWSVEADYSCWDPAEITPGENHKWNEDDRSVELAEIMYKISELMHKAKVENVNDLLGIPVEYTSKNGVLDTWRILEEVI